MKRFPRYLRIAFSATCLIACVLLITLWVRSYWNVYSAIRLVSPTTCVSPVIIEGQCEINWTSDPFTVSLVTRNGPGWNGGVKSLGDYYVDDGTERDGPHPFGSPTLRRFAFDDGLVVIPLWSLTVLFATFGIAPWLPWSHRFRLRTLLIATTLVAVGLGLAVWAAK